VELELESLLESCDGALTAMMIITVTNAAAMIMNGASFRSSEARASVGLSTSELANKPAKPQASTLLCKAMPHDRPARPTSQPASEGLTLSYNDHVFSTSPRRHASSTTSSSG